MPNRIIKDSINESKKLGEVSAFAQDLYKRLITYADDYGRFNADTEVMRARLYLRELESVLITDIINGLIELAGIEKIRFYTSSIEKDKVFGYFPRWTDHQRVRNTRAKCPNPEKEEVNDWYLRRFVPIDLKERLFVRDDFTCQECGKSFKLEGLPIKRVIRLLEGAIHIDHIVPVNQGGRATEENLRLLCASCSLKRPRNITVEDLLKFAATCGNLRQPSAAKSGSRPESNPDPIRIQSNPDPNPIMHEGRRTPAAFAQNLFSDFEKDFGRPLSPTEYEQITRWQEAHEPDVVKEALRRAVLNGKFNMRYIDRILLSWEKANCRTLREVMEYEEAYTQAKQGRTIQATDDDSAKKVVQLEKKRREETIRAACDFIKLQLGPDPPEDRARAMAAEYGEEMVPDILRRLYEGGRSP